MSQAAKVPRIVGICGSLRDDSLTRVALQTALQGAAEKDVETLLVDLRHYQLVFCTGNKNESILPPDVFRLRDEVKAAQGIILATPEYHGSFSGVLKNALDLMGFKEFEGKMIGLVGVSGGELGAINALNQLRMVGRALHAWVVPHQAAIPNAWKHIDAGGVRDKKLEERLKEVGRQVARFAFLHSSEKAMDFLHEWEAAPDNPGAGDI